LREDAYGFHARAIDEFLKALYSGYDVRDEAANLLFSVDNMRNHGYARIPLLKEAERQKTELYEFGTASADRPTQRAAFREESKVQTARSTKHEASRRPQRRAVEVFNRERWERAKENNNEAAINSMVRRALGWRMACRDNTEDYERDQITEPHHKVHALGLFARKGENYSTTPLLHHLSRSLYHDGKADAFNQAMVKAARKMDPSIRKLLGRWDGHNTNVNTMFDVGFQDFKKRYEEHFGKTLPDEMGKSLFMWSKNWENEGIPYSYIFDNAMNEGGTTLMSNAAHTMREAVRKDHSIADGDVSRRPSMNRSGVDAYRLGIYMLPREKQQGVMKWFLNGASDDKELKRVLGSNFDDAKGYMEIHSRIFNGALKNMYSGNSLRRGYNHRPQNRFVYDGKTKALIDESKTLSAEQIEERLQAGRDLNIEPDILRHALEGVDLRSLAEKMTDEPVVGGGKFPHFRRGGLLGNEYVEMTDEVPDLNVLFRSDIFDSDEGKKAWQSITSTISREFTRDAKIDEAHRSMEDMHSTHTFDEDFMPGEFKAEPTVLGMMMDAIGAYGNLHAEWDDIGQMRADAFPDMFFGAQKVRYFLPAHRKAYDMRYGDRQQRMTDTYTKTGDERMDRQEKDRLRQAAYLQGKKDSEVNDLLAQFDEKGKVVLRLPSREDPMGDTVRSIRREGDEGGLEDIADIYTAQMPLARVAHSEGLAGIIGAETNYRPDEMDPSGVLSLDGLRQDHDHVFSHPSSALSKLRAHAINTGHDKLLRAEHMTGGVAAQNIKHNQNDARHRNLIPAFKGYHDDLRVPVSEEDLKHFREGRILGRRHSDATGLLRDSSEVEADLFGDDVLGGGHYAIYSLEEYQKYLKSRASGKYTLPEPDVGTDGIVNFQQLLQEVKDHDHTGRSTSELRQALDKTGTVARGDNFSAFGVDNDGEPYVIGLSPSGLAISDREGVLQALNSETDDAKRDFLRARLQEITNSPERPNEQLRMLQHEDEKVQMALDTHNAKKQVFEHLLKPAIESKFPGIFGKEGMTEEENNIAYEATAYADHVAEYIVAHMSPSQRASLIENGKVVHGFGDQSDIREHITPENADALRGMKVTRDVHQAKMGRRTDGEQTSGDRLIEQLAATMPDKDRKALKIFQDVVAQVDEAADEQGIHFADAFRARYLPTQRVQKNGSFVNPKDGKFYYHQPRGSSRRRHVVRHPEPHDLHENMMEARDLMSENNRIDNNRYSSLPGGIYSTHEGEGHVHGGGDVLDSKNRPLTLNQEATAIYKVIQHVHQQLKGGSDVSLPGRLGSAEKLPKQSMFFPSVKASSKWFTSDTKDKHLLQLAEAISGKTQARGAGAHAQKEKADLNFGGSSLTNATMLPLSTSRRHQMEHGRRVQPPFTINLGALTSDSPNLFIESPANAHMQHAEAIQIPISPLAMQDVNPALGPYTGSNISMGQTLHSQEAERQGTSAPFARSFDELLDDTLFVKEDGKPPPVKFMHRIFDVDDMEHLRGFTGDWVLSHYPQGEQLIVTRKGKELTAYGADGDVKLDDVFSEEVDRVHEKDFVVHAVLHDGVLTFLDLLKTADEETHNMPTKDRIRHLRAQYESSEHIKMPEPINTKRSDDEGLRVAIEGLRKEENIDILLRDANATYMKGEPRHPKWVLLSKEKMVDVIVLSRAGGSYTVGVGPLMHPENYGKRAKQVGDEHYMMVGSAKGPRGLKEGDFATVRCTGVSASKAEHPVYRIRAAKMTDNEPLAADSVETLAILAGDHHVPQRVSMKKGRIVIHFPGFDDEVICKTRIEDSVWVVEPQQTIWGNEYLVRLAKDQQPYWSGAAAMLLKDDVEDEPEYDEVNPEPPAGHSKKPKKVLDEEEEVIKRGLDVLERALDHLSKEKITSTGVQGLGIGYATPDESPRGPTQNINDNTMPDFDPAARDDSDIKPPTAKKTKRLRSDKGEEARLTDDGTLQVL